ncbi:Arrestin domain-containing protein 1 [Orchesella cincta]|uniref:Arrestin domain-containing protein 1 n=1 Tax=Orchesella cincta TaxID=48709 RepID=A0A1D2M8F6_ORCCI|nr:Arrestin domain-containing protein 1 [Orchesella cincta]
MAFLPKPGGKRPSSWWRESRAIATPRKARVGRRGTVTNITSTRTHNSQNLLSISTYVAGMEERLCLIGGETSYPFSFPLPPHLVSSYYRSDGTTSLGITVTRKAIGIHTHLDLNAVPEASQAGEAEATKTFGNSLVCCYGGHNGSLTLKVKTEKRGFLPGETISFEVEIKNKSESVIKKVSAQLIEAVTVVIKGGSQCVPFPLPGMVESSQTVYRRG